VIEMMIEMECRALGGLNSNTVVMNTRQALAAGLRSGGPIQLKGGRTSVGQLQLDDDVEVGQIGMGPTMRINLRVKEGDTISGNQIRAQGISKARLQPTGQPLDEASFGAVRAALTDVYVRKGDRFIVTVSGEPIELCITRSRPGHGWLTSDSEIQLVGKPTKQGNGAIPSVSFDDIGGLDETIQEMKEIAVVPLIHPEVYKKAGQEPPKGILLYGPPGVGKTLLAKALAREAQCNFLTISGPELFTATYGESERKLREMFEQAKRDAPSVVYIDEIDAIASSRKTGNGELEKRILTQLLVELDGFEERGKVLVVGSTNMMESIDDALLRAGRFDRRIHVPYPDLDGREHILNIHTQSMPLADEVSLNALAKDTNGFTGADIANLCRQTAAASIRRVFPMERLMNAAQISEEELNNVTIQVQDFEEGMQRSMPFQVELRRPAKIGNISIDQVIGHKEAKKELKEHLVDPILHREQFEAMGLTCKGGVLLHGPPGTGKTMLGRAVANLSNVQFMSVSGPEFLSKWVGESERAVRELFQRAQELAPVVVFFDEFDAIGSQRDGQGGSHHTNSVVAQLLTLMDGLGGDDEIYFMASTNQPDLVDRAFLRPGRFDTSVFVGPLHRPLFPTFFENETQGVSQLIDAVDWEDITGQMVDKAPGAQLQGYVDKAKRISVQRALALGSEPCLERIDLDLALLETPSLSGGVERRPREIDDWGQDDDDDWVVP
jgi:transitional endoplasmic reticulum ATPase